MKRNLSILIIAAIAITSCSRTITGKITYVSGNKVVVDNHYPFKVNTDTLKLNDVVTFNPTANRSKMNSKKTGSW